MDLQKKMQIITDIMELDTESLRPDTLLSGLDCWDSMAKLQMIAAMDEEFGKELSAEQVKAFQSVADILAFMD